MLQWYCSQAQAFVITFSMNSKTSFDSIGQFMTAVGQSHKRHCPIALVGMQKEGSLEVEPEEAASFAAKLKVKHFHVQCGSDAQVVGPFVYLAQRHAQTRAKPRWTLKTRSRFRFRHCLWIIVYACIWIWACLKRQHFGMEHLENTNSTATTSVCGSVEQSCPIQSITSEDLSKRPGRQ